MSRAGHRYLPHPRCIAWRWPRCGAAETGGLRRVLVWAAWRGAGRAVVQRRRQGCVGAASGLQGVALAATWCSGDEKGCVA
jgi:hypothetical protein